QERYLTDCEDTLRGIADSARTGGEEILRAKGATTYGISAALVRIAKAILRDEHAVLTVSTVVSGQVDTRQVSLSVPAIVAREGVRRVLPLHLSEQEDWALARSAEILKRYLSMLELPDEGADSHERKPLTPSWMYTTR